MKWFTHLGFLALLTSCLACSDSQATSTPDPHPSTGATTSSGRGFGDVRVDLTPLSDVEVERLAARPLADVELCRSAWKTLKSPVLSEDPFQALHANGSVWSGSGEVEGVGTVHADPVAFGRISGRWTQDRKHAAINLDCPFPVRWRFRHPGFSVESLPEFRFVRGASLDRPRLGVEKETFEATGGLVVRHRERMISPKSEDIFDLGWTMRERTLSSAELMAARVAFGIPANAAVTAETDFARMPVSQGHPVQAISFSRSDDPNGNPGFWIMAGHYYHDRATSKPLFFRAPPAATPASGSAYPELVSAVTSAFGANFGFNDDNFEVWDSAHAQLYSTEGDPHGTLSSANLNHFLLPLYRDTIQAGGSLWVWLVWAPRPGEARYLTCVEIGPRGTLGASISYDLSDPTQLGLPAEPLDYPY